MTLALSSSRVLSHPAGLLADTVNDADSTRKVYLLAGGLTALGIALIVVTVWFWRSTRHDPELLGPLEMMAGRRFRDMDVRARQQLLDSVRPESAKPMRWGVLGAAASEPADVVDLRALNKVARPAGYDDLRDDSVSGDVIPVEVDSAAIDPGAVDPGAIEPELQPELHEIDRAADGVVEADDAAVPVDDAPAGGSETTDLPEADQTTETVLDDTAIETGDAEPAPLDDESTRSEVDHRKVETDRSVGIGSEAVIEGAAVEGPPVEVEAGEVEAGEAEAGEAEAGQVEAVEVETIGSANGDLASDVSEDTPPAIVPILIVPIDHELNGSSNSPGSGRRASPTRSAVTEHSGLDGPDHLDDFDESVADDNRTSIDPLLRKFDRNEG